LLRAPSSLALNPAREGNFYPVSLQHFFTRGTKSPSASPDADRGTLGTSPAPGPGTDKGRLKVSVLTVAVATAPALTATPGTPVLGSGGSKPTPVLGSGGSKPGRCGSPSAMRSASRADVTRASSGRNRCQQTGYFRYLVKFPYIKHTLRLHTHPHSHILERIRRLGF